MEGKSQEMEAQRGQDTYLESHTAVRLVPTELYCFFTRSTDLHSCEVSFHGGGVGIRDLK